MFAFATWQAAALLLSAPAPLALIAAVDRGGALPPELAPLAQALAGQGAVLVAGPELRSKLVGKAQLLGSSSPSGQESDLLGAQAAYDRGQYAQAAARAGSALQRGGPPSTQQEAVGRALEVLWGAALLQSKGRAAALPHFRAALIRDPQLIPDGDRFAPPVQRLVEELRAQLGQAPQATLSVSPAFAVDPREAPTVFLDGTPRAPLPSELKLIPHPARVWVEGQGEAGLVHAVEGADGERLAIAWPLEGALRLGPHGTDVWLELPDSPVRRRQVLSQTAVRAGAGGVLLVRTSAAQWVVSWQRADGVPLGSISFSAVGKGPDWSALAHQVLSLTATAGPVAESTPPGLSVRTAAEPVAAPPSVGGGGGPWLALAVIGGAAVLAGGAVALAFALAPSDSLRLRAGGAAMP